VIHITADFDRNGRTVSTAVTRDSEFPGSPLIDRVIVDMNENGVVDVGFQNNGEDNSNGYINEDVNDNGLLDPGEDTNSNGLLDVAVHPDYPHNQLIYLSYSGGSPGHTGTEVLRARLNLKEYRLDDVKIIFKMHPKLDSNHHFGSRLLFDDKGYLFITLGERGQMQEAQNLGSHQGKVIRLNDDGSLPQDNPFVGVAGALPEIYTYGHRNVQGIAIHPVTREIWTHEHGPRGGDEVNILKPGTNYGWPVITYGIDYDGSVISTQTHQEGMEQPVMYWVPSIAPCGMMFYTGKKFPAWKGNLFAGALGKMHLRRVVFDKKGRPSGGQELLLELRARIRNVSQGPDGSIYVLTDSRNGSVLRLE
jgi:glucose/arabinose dehydrogenase